MSRNKIIILSALIVLLASLAGGGAMMHPINRQREALQITFNPDVTKNMPPSVAIPNVMLGGFRGLAVDMMWMRLNEMKQAGQYHEMNDLAQWICQLHPRYPKVWAYHAWNMSYNVSVATFTAEERWKWVRDGIELLRDQGIPLNPDSVMLYKELSWIFLHKLGHTADEMHWYYREQFAREWHELLGPPPPEARAIVVADAFRVIADAFSAYVDPQRPTAQELTPLEAFARSEPDAANELHKLLDLGYEPGVTLLRAIGRAQALRDSIDVRYMQAGRLTTFDQIDQRLDDWLADESIDPDDRAALLALLRAKVLFEHYHMDPSFMMAIMDGTIFPEVDQWQEYLDSWEPEDRPLPLDWRHPGSHALYWAAMGEKVARRLLNIEEKEIDVMNTYRQVVHAVQQLRDSGGMIFDPVTGILRLRPDPRHIPAYERVFFAAGSKFGDGHLHEQAPDAPRTFRSGHENVLIWAIQLSYYYGEKAQAQRLYDRLRREYSDFDPSRPHRYQLTLDDFVVDALMRGSDVMGMDEVRRTVYGLFRQAIQEGYLNGREDIARNLKNRAKRVYDLYMAKRVRPNPEGLHERPRVVLPPFEEMFRNELKTFLEAPPERVRPLLKARLWRALTVQDQRRLYRRLNLKQLRQEADDVGLDPSKMYPVPEGMKEYIEEQLRLEDQADWELRKDKPTTGRDAQ